MVLTGSAAVVCFVFFKQKTAYEMRISDWSSDVCSSDLIAEDILAYFREPFDIADHHLIVTASMGIAVAPQDGRDRDEILQHADMALYQAQHGGRNRYSLFECSKKERTHRVREIEAGLRRPPDRGHFTMPYQPISALEPYQIARAVPQNI